MRILTIGISAMFLVAGGCLGGGIEGEMGRGSFRYSCTDDEADPSYCSDSGGYNNFPEKLAVDATFGITYVSDEEDDLPVIPGSPVHAGAGASSAVIRVDGPAAFLAMDLDNRVFDLVHLRAFPVSWIDLEISSQELSVGNSKEITAAPMSGDDVVLGGSLDYDWKSSDEDVVTITSAGLGRQVEIEAVGPGVANVTVEAGGGTGAVTITVEGGE